MGYICDLFKVVFFTKCSLGSARTSEPSSVTVFCISILGLRGYLGVGMANSCRIIIIRIPILVPVTYFDWTITCPWTINLEAHNLLVCYDQHNNSLFILFTQKSPKFVLVCKDLCWNTIQTVSVLDTTLWSIPEEFLTLLQVEVWVELSNWSNQGRNSKLTFTFFLLTLIAWKNNLLSMLDTFNQHLPMILSNNYWHQSKPTSFTWYWKRCCSLICATGHEVYPNYWPRF